MTVVYYTSTYFLDLSLDIISVLKEHVDLHVFIEVTRHSKKVTIANIDEFPGGKQLATPAEVLTPESYHELSPYFRGTASTHFVIHNHPTGFSTSTLQASMAVWRFVKPFKPQVIYFEGYTLRTIGMLPFLFSLKKVYLALHDPVPHSGEKSWKISLPNFLLFNLPFKRRFIFYSHFARNLFTNNYKNVKDPKLLVKMRPYSYYKQQVHHTNAHGGKHILFFGRLSPYKGVDILLKAMPEVFTIFPGEQLIIAGKAINGYTLNQEIPARYPHNIENISRYITNTELVQLINNAKFIVCPYLDATQSGVLMTAFALNTPVIASNVGSFPEFVVHNFNGMLVPASNPEALAEAMITALTDNYYQTLKTNLMQSNAQNTWSNSLAAILTEIKE